MTTMTVPIITISGRYLNQGDTRFIVRGIVYQPHPTVRMPHGTLDPLSDDQLDKIRQDISNFKELGVNTLWVYYIDPLLSHDTCMKLLAENGIYIVALLSSSRQAINRMNPRQSYTSDLRRRYEDVVDCLSMYTNVIGVCITNSLINDRCRKLGLIPEICEVISTAVGDLKNHMESQHAAKGQRVLLVCISDDSWALLNSGSFEYLADAGVEERPERGFIDFYCFTHYESMENSVEVPWMGQNKPTPKFKEMHLHPKFQNMKRVLPILCSEYSDSNISRPRHFNQVIELYSSSRDTAVGGSKTSPMLEILSGAFLYEYSEGANAYGLVKQEHDGTSTKLPDFYSFKNQMSAIL